LCLLWTGPASGKPTVPPKMLHKIRAANMKTMTKANSLVSHTDGGELSTHKLKELGRNAEKEATERYPLVWAKKSVASSDMSCRWQR
jgi:hypothetical protein